MCIRDRVYSDEGAEWRVIDVVRHVADSERGMTALMAQVQAGGEGVPADFDLTRWNRRVVAKLQDKGPADLLAGMSANREALFAFIDTLADDDWAKPVSYTHLDVYKRQAPGRMLYSPPCTMR